MSLIRFSVPLLAIAASGCAVVQPEAYIRGTHQPLTVLVTPRTAVCDVTQGDAHVGTVRHGVGKLTLAKSRETVTVKCAAFGYETGTATLESSLGFYSALRCAFDGLCEPAVQSGSLNQYPARLEMALQAVRPTAAQKLAAAKAVEPVVSAAPVPATTPDPVVSFKRLPPLPPAVQALRAKLQAKAAKETKPEMPAAAAMASDYPPARKAAPMESAPTYAGAPLGTWRTTSSGAMAWWGRDVPHSFTMPSTAWLSLQRTDGDWGLFDYRGEDGARGRVWIALSDVRLTN